MQITYMNNIDIVVFRIKNWTMDICGVVEFYL